MAKELFARAGRVCQTKIGFESARAGKEGTMISDALFEAEETIVEHLTKNPDMYTGELRTRLENLLEELDAVRSLPGLDCPPDWPTEHRRTAEEIFLAFALGDFTA
jgi:hypothetical protein